MAGGPDRVAADVWKFFSDAAPGEQAKVWVMFTDKATGSSSQRAAALNSVASRYDARAVARRQKRRTAPGLFDDRDLPVADSYLQQVRATGASVDVISRWLNAVSATADGEQIKSIAALPFVKSVQLVGRGRRDMPEQPPAKIVESSGRQPDSTSAFNYGQSATQLNQINVPALHNLGYSGAGVVLAVLDSGFYKDHENVAASRILAEWDFVKNDGNTQNEANDVPSQHNHGTKVLSIAAGYKDGTMYGPAYQADVILCKTEDGGQEAPIEEDWFVAGLEFAEAHGADVLTSSLGYIDWYTQAQLDGQTAVTTLGVNIAVANGLLCLNAAGNQGGIGPSLIAPADAYKVITVGAIDSSGIIASFSSRGPTADGRVKPEVVALGINDFGAATSSPTAYSSGNGTSYATPLVAGVCALLLEAHPDWTVDQVRTALCQTGDYYLAHGTYDPAYARGYGKIDALAAYRMPTVVSVVSRRVHGSAGPFDLDVTDPGTVEPRAGGPQHLLITFDQPLQIVGTALSAVQLSSGSASSVSVAGNQLEVLLSGAANAVSLVVQFPGVAHAAQAGARAGDQLCIRVLAGDCVGDATVDLLDVVTVRNALEVPISAGNFLADVDMDGQINIFDMVAVRNQLNTAATACP